MGGVGIFIIIVAIFALYLFVVFIPVRHWIAAIFADVHISMFSLIGMRLRRVPPAIIVNALIQARKAGIDVTADILETHYLSGGNVLRVVDALVAADKAGIDLSVKRATAIDLAGRNVLDAVKMSVNPKVIDTPMVTAVARVTVRANIDRLVGGAGEETILARVGEGIVSTIGSADNHKIVLENPDSISKVVLAKGLYAGTAFEILSIDIADVNVGKNIGAQLQTDQANADKEIAQAKAEERRAMAVSLDQEMKAKVCEMQAKLIDVEAQVPLAIALAFRSNQVKI